MDPFQSLKDHLYALGFSDGKVGKVLAECTAERDALKAGLAQFRRMYHEAADSRDALKAANAELYSALEKAMEYVSHWPDCGIYDGHECDCHARPFEQALAKHRVT